MATMTEPSELRDIPFANFDAAMVSTAASHGDPIALEAFRITGELLGYALADAVTITSPEAIFLFGGETIRGFIFALLCGVAIGTYSSWFIATPLSFDLMPESIKNKGKE